MVIRTQRIERLQILFHIESTIRYGKVNCIFFPWSNTQLPVNAYPIWFVLQLAINNLQDFEVKFQESQIPNPALFRNPRSLFSWLSSVGRFHAQNLTHITDNWIETTVQHSIDTNQICYIYNTDYHHTLAQTIFFLFISNSNNNKKNRDLFWWLLTKNDLQFYSKTQSSYLIGAFRPKQNSHTTPTLPLQSLCFYIFLCISSTNCSNKQLT